MGLAAHACAGPESSRPIARRPSRDLAVLVAVRACYFGAFVLYFWLGTHAFHAGVPLLLAMAATPIILVVGALPITPAGLGTQQAAMLYLFAPYGSEAAILAFALSFPSR